MPLLTTSALTEVGTITCPYRADKALGTVVTRIAPEKGTVVLPAASLSPAGPPRAVALELLPVGQTVLRREKTRIPRQTGLSFQVVWVNMVTTNKPYTAYVAGLHVRWRSSSDVLSAL